MDTFKLKEDYSDFTIDKMDSLWIKTKGNWSDTTPGIPGNPNVVWATGTQADYMAKGAAMKLLQEAAPTGTQTQKDNYKASRVSFLKAAGVMAVQANEQCGGDEAKLKSTGLTMNAVHAEVGQMDKAVIESATPTDGVVGRVVIVMKKSAKYCHGTWIELTNVTTGAVTQLYSHSKHELILTDLIPLNRYSVRVAYDGTDPLKVWSDPKPFLGQ